MTLKLANGMVVLFPGSGVTGRCLRCAVWAAWAACATRSDDAAVGADDLAVDPVAGGRGEEGDVLGCVGRGAEPFQRGLGRQAGDGLFVLAVEEQVGGG